MKTSQKEGDTIYSSKGVQNLLAVCCVLLHPKKWFTAALSIKYLK